MVNCNKLKKKFKKNLKLFAKVNIFNTITLGFEPLILNIFSFVYFVIFTLIENIKIKRLSKTKTSTLKYL